jgi:hypothetical protein
VIELVKTFPTRARYPRNRVEERLSTFKKVGFINAREICPPPT